MNGTHYNIQRKVDNHYNLRKLCKLCSLYNMCNLRILYSFRNLYILYNVDSLDKELYHHNYDNLYNLSIKHYR